MKRVVVGIWWIMRGLVILATTAALPLVAVGVAVALWIFVLLPGTIPEPRPNPSYAPTVVLSSDGTPMGAIESFDLALPVGLDDVNENMKAAVVASEDRRFFEHEGIDLFGIARAVRDNMEGDFLQGGSTITQQLVKQQYLSGERTLDRKLREAIVAQQLEKTLTKEEILRRYLEVSYFGSGATGIQAAAQRYFRTQARDLTLSQSAYLAGVLPSPTSFAAHRNLETAEKQRLVVLNSVEQTQGASPQDIAAARKERLVLVDGFGNPPPGTTGPFTAVYPTPENELLGYFPKILSYIQDYLITNYGADAVSRGYVVQTTIDLNDQKAAQEAVNRAVRGSADKTVAAALVAVEPETGFVKAMVDTSLWEDSQVNYATGGSVGFQVGSSAKAFVLAAALQDGMGPQTQVQAPGQLVTAGGDVVRNFGGGAGGTMTLRTATEQSWNTPFVDLAQKLGPEKVAETARNLGIVSWGPDRSYGPSIALGAYETSPWEMAGAFATFANNGRHQTPTMILTIKDQQGATIKDNTKRVASEVVDAAVAGNVNDILKGVVTAGTGTAGAIDRPVAGKTGTAENFSAAWFVGYTPQLACAVWLGHLDGVRELPQWDGSGPQVGGGIPAQTFSRFMREALAQEPVMEFDPPKPIVKEPEIDEPRKEPEVISPGRRQFPQPPP